MGVLGFHSGALESNAMEPLVLIECEDETNAEGKRKMVKTAVKNWYNCTYRGCNFNGRTSAGLERHLKNHSAERVYACSKCDRRCTSQSLLNEHMKVHSDKKPFWCLLCEYKCRNKANLKSHLRTHSDERPHACHLCDYKSKTYMNLKNHLRKHTGEKPYSCPACSYRCSTQGSLNVHLRVHTGEKPYTCSECSYKSTTSGGLKSHYKVHSGDKPFKCGECPESFAKLSLLRNHRNSHVKDKTYRCSSCDFLSEVPDEINRHIAEHVDPWETLEFPGNRKKNLKKGPDAGAGSSSPTSSKCEFPGNSAEIPKRAYEESDSSSGISSGDFSQPKQTQFHAANQVPDMKRQQIRSDESPLKPTTSSQISTLTNDQPVFSLPFSFLDKLFPPNHLHEKYWNENGMKSKFSGHLSMFLENCG